MLAEVRGEMERFWNTYRRQARGSYLIPIRNLNPPKNPLMYCHPTERLCDLCRVSERLYNLCRVTQRG